MLECRQTLGPERDLTAGSKQPAPAVRQDHPEVLFTDVDVDVDRSTARPVTICPILLDARDPKLFTRGRIDVIARHALRATQRSTAVVGGPPGLRKPNAADPCRTAVAARLELDVHDAFEVGHTEEAKSGSACRGGR